MELLGVQIEYILITCVFLLSSFSVYLILCLRKERDRISKLEQATTHLALELETLNSGASESEEKPALQVQLLEVLQVGDWGRFGALLV